MPPVGDKGKKDHPNSFSLQDGVCVLSTAADFVQCATPSVHTLQLLGTPPRVILLSLFLSLHQSIIGKRHPASFPLLTSFPPPGTRSWNSVLVKANDSVLVSRLRLLLNPFSSPSIVLPVSTMKIHWLTFTPTQEAVKTDDAPRCFCLLTKKMNFPPSRGVPNLS